MTTQHTGDAGDSRLPEIEVNGRTYGSSAAPVVVVCVDGGAAAYHDEAIAGGHMPFLAGLLEKRGTMLLADSVMPSFTNPNNLSIATGVSPAVHGICGNYFYDPVSDSEVMMNDPKWLRAPTIFSSYEEQGASVTIITAKDKLRRLLGSGLEKGKCFSAENESQASVYSAALSEFVMTSGADLARTERPDLMYLSLTDYIQHKHAPGSPEANSFYAMLDRNYQKLDALGYVLVITADHGMNAKPNVVYLQAQLDALLGASTARVILPITDPYTVHHGALGSFATVHLPPDADFTKVSDELAKTMGIAEVLGKVEACKRFELPEYRMGDLVVIAEHDTALGTSPERHDLSGLDAPLRSHGGLSEQQVPFIVNRKLKKLPENHRLRNYDAYWVAMNCIL